MPILFWDILLLKLTHPAVGLFQSSSFGYSVEMFSIDGPVLSGSVFLVTMQVVIPVPVHREIVVDMSHPCPHFLQQRIVHLLCTERIVGMQEGFIQSMSDFQHGLFRELGNPLPVQPLSVAIEVLRVDLQFFAFGVAQQLRISFLVQNDPELLNSLQLLNLFSVVVPDQTLQIIHVLRPDHLVTEQRGYLLQRLLKLRCSLFTALLLAFVDAGELGIVLGDPVRKPKYPPGQTQVPGTVDTLAVTVTVYWFGTSRANQNNESMLYHSTPTTTIKK